jgi:hypothetical protein
VNEPGPKRKKRGVKPRDVPVPPESSDPEQQRARLIALAANQHLANKRARDRRTYQRRRRRELGLPSLGLDYGDLTQVGKKTRIPLRKPRKRPGEKSRWDRNTERIRKLAALKRLFP